MSVEYVERGAGEGRGDHRDHLQVVAVEQLASLTITNTLVTLSVTGPVTGAKPKRTLQMAQVTPGGWQTDRQIDVFIRLRTNTRQTNVFNIWCVFITRNVKLRIHLLPS